MDNTGLMRPGPTVAAADDDERRRKEEGFVGLMRAILPALGMIPGPVGMVADMGYEVADKGWAKGLASGAANLAMGRAIKAGPKVLKMYEKAPKAVLKTQEAQRIYDDALANQDPLFQYIKRNLYSKEARDYFAKSGKFIDVEGNRLREFSDHDARPTDQLLRAVERQLADQDPKQFMVHSNKNFFDHPELYKRYPSLADAEVTIGFRKDKDYYTGTHTRDSKNKVELFVPPVNNSKRGILDSWLHEMQHAVQEKNDLAGGASPRAIEEELVKALMHHKAKPEEILNLRDKIKYEARQRYLLSEGELGAVMTAARRNLTPEQRRQSYPLDYQVFGNSSPIEAEHRVLKPYDTQQIDKIARQLLGIPENP